MGVDYRVVVDGAGPSLIARGLVDAVVVGADRVAANGDVANKIGTYPLALAAARAGIPFVVAAPESTVDPATPDGAAIDDRGPRRRRGAGVGRRARSAPAGARAVNPAFDVTPADLVTAVVTERRVVRPASGSASPDGDPPRAIADPWHDRVDMAGAGAPAGRRAREESLGRRGGGADRRRRGAVRVRVPAAGADPSLVLAGGGNSSVKTTERDVLRRPGRRAPRQGQRLGHGRARARRASRPLRLATGGPPRRAARAVRRPHGGRAEGGVARPVGPGAVGRVDPARHPAVPVRAAHPRRRRARAHQHARRRGARRARSTATTSSSCRT